MKTFYQRVVKNILLASVIMLICLGIGIVGYHYTADIPWLDAITQCIHDIKWHGASSGNKDRSRKMVFFFLRLVQRRCVHYQYWRYPRPGYAPDVSPVAH